MYEKLKQNLNLSYDTLANYFEKYCSLTSLDEEREPLKVIQLEYILSLFIASYNNNNNNEFKSS